MQLVINKTMKRATFTLIATLAVASCGQKYVEVEEVLNHHACKGLAKGLHLINAARLPALRGAQLLEMNGATAQTGPELQSGGVLVAISNGEQPSLGYAMHPDQATLSETHLSLDYVWQQPDPARRHAQMVSSPCSVIRLPPHQVQTLTVTVAGKALGNLEIQPLAQ